MGRWLSSTCEKYSTKPPVGKRCKVCPPLDYSSLNLNARSCSSLGDDPLGDNPDRVVQREQVAVARVKGASVRRHHRDVTPDDGTRQGRRSPNDGLLDRRQRQRTQEP